jgi:hypothetical protein
VTFSFKLDCGASARFPAALSALVPTATLTLSAGFRAVPPAPGCGYGGFSRGVHYFGGEATLKTGSSFLGVEARVNGRALLGLVCADDQWRSSPVRTGVSVLVTGTLFVWGQANPRAFYVEPSSGGVCGQQQTGAILPPGTGFDAGVVRGEADALSYNMIETGWGSCF